MQRARAAIALLAVLAIDAPADKLLGNAALDGAAAQRPDMRASLPVPSRDALTHVAVSIAH